MSNISEANAGNNKTDKLGGGNVSTNKSLNHETINHWKLKPKIAPIKTITGEADIAKGCATNSNHIFRGKLINFDKNNGVTNKIPSVIIICENIQWAKVKLLDCYVNTINTVLIAQCVISVKFLYIELSKK